MRKIFALLLMVTCCVSLAWAEMLADGANSGTVFLNEKEGGFDFQPLPFDAKNVEIVVERVSFGNRQTPQDFRTMFLNSGVTGVVEKGDPTPSESFNGYLVIPGGMKVKWMVHGCAGILLFPGGKCYSFMVKPEYQDASCDLE